MALDVYFKDDIARILRSIKNANELKQGNDASYDDGFNAALGCIALAFGVMLNGEFADYEKHRERLNNGI